MNTGDCVLIDGEPYMLATERRDLMSEPPYRWISTEHIDPLPETIDPLYPVAAKKLFLLRWDELTSPAPAASPAAND